MKNVKEIDFKRVNNDINGNPRYVCHFLNFVVDSDKGSISDKYDIAVKRAKEVGGKRYSNKSYGGGIVIQSYNIIEDSKAIEELMKQFK